MKSARGKSERDQWIEIKRKITSYNANIYWEQGFELFKRGIDKKLIGPIDSIIKLRNHHGEGFAILTIQCVLIETFSAFQFGKIFNHRYNPKNDPGYQYSDSRKIFVDLLYSKKIFENHFFVIKNGTNKIDTPFDANDFYSNVRCALVHEGRTRKNWTINVRSRKLSDNIFIKEIGGERKIYRTSLQVALKQHLDDYLNELRKNDNSELRKYFGRKMDHLYQLKKNKLDWWKDD